MQPEHLARFRMSLRSDATRCLRVGFGRRVSRLSDLFSNMTDSTQGKARHTGPCCLASLTDSIQPSDIALVSDKAHVVLCCVLIYSTVYLYRVSAREGLAEGALVATTTRRAVLSGRDDVASIEIDKGIAQ